LLIGWEILELSPIDCPPPLPHLGRQSIAEVRKVGKSTFRKLHEFAVRKVFSNAVFSAKSERISPQVVSIYWSELWLSELWLCFHGWLPVSEPKCRKPEIDQVDSASTEFEKEQNENIFSDRDFSVSFGPNKLWAVSFESLELRVHELWVRFVLTSGEAARGD
jgi:hypothetical protein